MGARRTASRRPKAVAGTSERNRRLERNRLLVLNVYEHVLKPLDESRVDDYFRPDYIQHNPMARTGAEGLKKFLSWAKSVSPSAEHHVRRLFADGDFVIAHVHVIIQPGETGSAVVDIFRIQDGLVAEHWDVAQQIPLRAQNQNSMF